VSETTTEEKTTEDKKIHRLLEAECKYNASDLHLKAGAPPLLRIKGEIRPLNLPPLSPQEVKDLIYPIMREEQRVVFEDTGDMDFAYSLPGMGRFRINVFRQRGQVSVAIRRVQIRIPSFEELHLPPVMRDIASYHQGLVIVSGITGSGKSTTLAAMIQHINTTRRCHIITIEDPIEYLFRDEKAFINQREIGIDVSSWSTALKYVVRQDPDVILIGEMRDTETFAAGLTAAETGHLVFGTLHSSTVAQTFGRILDLFPRDRHPLIRNSLAFNLRAIISQKLLPSIKEGVDRVPACEIMLVNATIRKLIREEEDEKIADAIRIGREEGMQDYTESLRQLVENELVDRQTALEVAPNPEALRMALKGISTGESAILR